MPVKLNSRLPEIVLEIQIRADRAVHEGAEEVRERAKARVPVREGNLRDAIHVEREDAAAYEVVAGDDDVFYGHMVEHGTTHSAPRPFLVPSLDDARGDVVDLVQRSLRGL